MGGQFQLRRKIPTWTQNQLQEDVGGDAGVQMGAVDTTEAPSVVSHDVIHTGIRQMLGPAVVAGVAVLEADDKMDREPAGKNR